MCGELIGSWERVARKNHTCTVCGYLIPNGFKYIACADVEDKSVRSSKWHIECRDEFDQLFSDDGIDCGDPSEVWERGLPLEIKWRYVYGPFELEE